MKVALYIVALAVIALGANYVGMEARSAEAGVCTFALGTILFSAACAYKHGFGWI